MKKEPLFYFADFETLTDEKGRQFVILAGVATQRGRIRYFEGENCLSDFFDYLLEDSSIKRIFFHNFGQFDCIFLLDYLVTFKLEQETPRCIYRNGRYYEIQWRNLHFVDSYLLVPCSLKEGALLFNRHFFKQKWSAEATPEQWKTYLKHDVYALREMLLSVNCLLQSIYKNNKNYLMEFSLSSITHKEYLQTVK